MSKPTAVPNPPPGYESKVCPILSVSSAIASQLREEPGRLVLAGAAQPNGGAKEPEAVACLGPACALYLKQLNEKGEVVGGSCSIATSPVGLNQLAVVINNFTASLFGFLNAVAQKFGIEAPGTDSESNQSQQ